jgi:Cu+-exporting ATPase
MAERQWAALVASQSAHPHSRRIAQDLPRVQPIGISAVSQVTDFSEVVGSGIRGCVEGHQIRLGSRAWLEHYGIPVRTAELLSGSASYLAIDGSFRGTFVFETALRPDTKALLAGLGEYELALVSGDNEKERDRFAALFGRRACLRFNQSPIDKLAFVEQLQAAGKRVMMIGDGLNDAGALKRSDVGVAVVETVGIFSPASDVILEASQVPHLARILKFSRYSTRVVRASFAVSAAYNLVGVGIAAAGLLSPLVCAVLMPLSSITVVLFACGATKWAARRTGINAAPNPNTPFKTGDIQLGGRLSTPQPALRAA